MERCSSSRLGFILSLLDAVIHDLNHLAVLQPVSSIIRSLP